MMHMIDTTKVRTLGDLARRYPDRMVKLHFASKRGTGTLVTTAEHAAYPNVSQRFFPPAGLHASLDLGWPEPFWYASEIERIEVLS